MHVNVIKKCREKQINILFMSREKRWERFFSISLEKVVSPVVQENVILSKLGGVNILVVA